MHRCRPLALEADPAMVLRRWPAPQPLAAIWSEAGAPSPWIIIASPRRFLTPDETATRLARPLPTTQDTSALPPFRGGLIGWCSYDLGADLEPRAVHDAARPRTHHTPPMLWAECPNALAYNAAAGEWWEIGDASRLIEAAKAPDPIGHDWFHVGHVHSAMGREAYVSACERVIEYIRAGDVYQVNLAHRLAAEFAGSPRAFWRALVRHARPWHGAYVESSGLVLAGASPELFLSYDPATRRVTTRPMKGTRPIASGEAALRESEKDRAELAMIVDLMRNDLGRACELGSIRVDDPRSIERHGVHRRDAEAQRPDEKIQIELKPIPDRFLSDLCASAVNPGLLQATATISGTPRDGATVLDLLRAAFPCGSVTGAPKIRAMQIIDELEPSRRGLYCGAAGYISDHGAVSLGVSIRSAVIQSFDAAPGQLVYSVGAGIVADSDPEAEWLETLDKARVLFAAVAESAPGVHA